MSGSPTREELNSLVCLCHSLASPFLARKVAAGSFVTAQGICISDLAYDCIAELFQQDSGGVYTQLRSYFSGIPLSECGDEELLPHLRRLVFSKVNQAVFRLYSEYDPALSKILRNIKSAMQSLQSFTMVERFGEHCLVPGMCETLEHMPPFGFDELEKLFLPQTTGREHIPELLAKLSLHIRHQDTRCRIIPLMTAGLLIRAVYSERHQEQDNVVIGDQLLISHDASMAIRHACREVEMRIRRKYVSRKKVPESIFQDYFQVIAEHLSEKFIGGNGSDPCLFEGLRKFHPHLTKQAYTQEHRNRLEYILKLVQKETLRRFHES